MLEAKDINLYYGAAQALRSVSISAEPGKVTCVLGRNGVGKTSLLRAMVGQYPIASGSITFDGRGAASASCRRAERSFRCSRSRKT
jgi:urea transport system ATP-binding protein